MRYPDAIPAATLKSAAMVFNTRGEENIVVTLNISILVRSYTLNTSAKDVQCTVTEHAFGALFLGN